MLARIELGVAGKALIGRCVGLAQGRGYGLETRVVLPVHHVAGAADAANKNRVRQESVQPVRGERTTASLAVG